jgi:hypothetical protein
LFVTYLITLFLIYKIIENKKPLKSFKWKWFGISLGSLYLYGLFLHVIYTKILGVKITDFIITGNNGEISSSTLSHTHVAKGAVGIILSKIGFTDLAKVDAGGAYIGVIPNILFYIGSILLLIVLLQVIWYFASSFYSKIKDRNATQKFFLIIGYAILSFSIIKTSIDGGLLNYGFYIGAFFVWAFSMREKNKFNLNYYYIITFFSLLFLVTNIFMADIDPSLALLLAELASIILLYEIILYLTKEKVRLQFLIPIIFIFLGSWWQAGVRDLDIYNYGENIIEPGQNFYIYDKDKNEVIKKNLEKDTSIHNIIKSIDKNESYLPVTVPGITCMEKSYPEEVSMDVLTNMPIRNKVIGQKEFITLKSEESIIYGKYWKTNFHIYMNPCLPEPLSVIDGMIRKSGINTYVMVNPIFYDQFNNL